MNIQKRYPNVATASLKDLEQRTNRRKHGKVERFKAASKSVQQSAGDETLPCSGVICKCSVHSGKFDLE